MPRVRWGGRAVWKRRVRWSTKFVANTKLPFEAASASRKRRSCIAAVGIALRGSGDCRAPPVARRLLQGVTGWRVKENIFLLELEWKRFAPTPQYRRRKASTWKSLLVADEDASSTTRRTAPLGVVLSFRSEACGRAWNPHRTLACPDFRRWA